MFMALSGPRVHVSGIQVEVRGTSGSRLLTSPPAESQPCDYFWCKGPNKPPAGHDLSDPNQMCRA